MRMIFAAVCLLAASAGAEHPSFSDAALSAAGVAAGDIAVSARKELAAGRKKRVLHLEFASLGSAGPMRCQCAQWGQIYSASQRVCDHRQCYVDADGHRSCDPCDSWRNIEYDYIYCQQWKQNFCNSWSTASLGEPSAAGPVPALFTEQPAPIVPASLSCPGREIEYDAAVQLCNPLYRYQRGGEWTPQNYQGGSSCSTKNIRLHECE